MSTSCALHLILQKVFSLFVVGALLAYGIVLPPAAVAGGPIVVGGNFGVPGTPFTWDLSSFPSGIPYRTDTGMLGTLTNSQANTLVQTMFGVWQNVPTAAISYNNVGPIQGVAGGHVASVADFNTVNCPQSGPGAGQNPIVFDTDGSLFAALGMSANIIGFAGPGLLNASGRITCGTAALNGKCLSTGCPAVLTQDQFSAAFIHEFGHFSGLDHSQMNTNCDPRVNPTSCPSNSDDARGLPTMYPALLTSVTELDSSGNTIPAQKTLAEDDKAWISRLYPVTAPASGKMLTNSFYGTISGTVTFSDGVTQAQGVNVIARNTSAPRRIAMSVVSGYLYTGNRGQTVTGNNNSGSAFGSRNPQLAGSFDIPVPAGSYTVEVESILPGFNGSSSVGPLSTPIPMPGTAPAPATPPAVAAGASVTGVTITLIGTPPRFDAFESAGLTRPEPLPLWLRKESLESQQEAS